MKEPHILFKKISYYETPGAQGRKERMAVTHGDLGDTDVYVVAPQYETDARKRLRKSGNVVLAQRENGDQEILHAETPEPRPGDPYAPELTLAMLAFAALKDAPDVQEDRHISRLFMHADDLSEQTEGLYRRTLGMRMRRTGHLTGGRPTSATLQTSQRRAVGNSMQVFHEQDIKYSTTSGEDHDKAPGWRDEHSA